MEPGSSGSPVKLSARDSAGKSPGNMESANGAIDSVDDVDAHPVKRRKMSDLDTPKRERVNLTLRGLMPSPINFAARRKKADARLKKMVRNGHHVDFQEGRKYCASDLVAWPPSPRSATTHVHTPPVSALFQLITSDFAKNYL